MGNNYTKRIPILGRKWTENWPVAKKWPYKNGRSVLEVDPDAHGSREHVLLFVVCTDEEILPSAKAGHKMHISSLIFLRQDGWSVSEMCLLFAVKSFGTVPVFKRVLKCCKADFYELY